MKKPAFKWRNKVDKWVLIAEFIAFLIFIIALSIHFAGAEPYTIPQEVQQSAVYNILLPCTNNGTDCSTSTICNVSLNDPTGNVIFNGRIASATFYPQWNVTINETQTSTQGWYNGYYTCKDGSLSGKEQYKFLVTGNGRALPSGGVIVLFSILLIVVLASAIYVLFYSIGHYATLDLDVKDLGFNLGALFSLFAIIYLAKYYLGNPDILSLLNPILIASSILNGFVPLLFFILSISIGTVIRNKHQLTGGLDDEI